MPDAEACAPQEVVIRSLAGPIEIERITVEPPIARVKVMSKSTDEAEATLMIQAAGGAESDARSAPGATITVALTHPTCQELHIPLYRLGEPLASSADTARAIDNTEKSVSEGRR